MADNLIAKSELPSVVPISESSKTAQLLLVLLQFPSRLEMRPHMVHHETPDVSIPARTLIVLHVLLRRDADARETLGDGIRANVDAGLRTTSAGIRADVDAGLLKRTMK